MGVIGEVLEHIGLTPTETKVYLALLEMGEGTTGEILSKAKLNSGRIYDVLASLELKGLVSSIKKSKVKHFRASPPERIQHFLEEQKEDIQTKENQLKEILPDLEGSYNASKEDIEVELYIGAEGQKTAYSILHNESTKSKDLLVYGIVSRERYPKEVLDTLNFDVYKERRSRGLRARKLVAEEARDEVMYTQDDSTRRFLPFPTMVGFEVLGDVTMLLYERKPIITLLMQSKEIADDYRTHFEFLWEHAAE